MVTSIPMQLTAVAVRMLYRPDAQTPERVRAHLAAPKGSGEPPLSLRRACVVSTSEVAGFPVHTVLPPGQSRPERVVVYLHGGSYVDEIVRQHWGLVRRFARAGCRVEVPLYGLAPEHTVEEAVPFVLAILAGLERTYAMSDVVLAGDSAGGGLAVAVTHALRDAGRPVPRRLLLDAPWLDVRMAGPDLERFAARDPWLSADALRTMGAVWAGDRDPADPWASPVTGSFEGFPPVEVWTGTRDVLHPDALALSERALEAGVDATLHVVAGAVHVYPLTPTPEGRRGAAQMVQAALR